MCKKEVLAEGIVEIFGEECLEESFWKKLRKKFSDKTDREVSARARVARVADLHGDAASYYADRFAQVREKPWMKGKRADDAETEYALRYNQHALRYTDLKKGKKFEKLRATAMRGRK